MATEVRAVIAIAAVPAAAASADTKSKTTPAVKKLQEFLFPIEAVIPASYGVVIFARSWLGCLEV
jgi:hypothetical protein